MEIFNIKRKKKSKNFMTLIVAYALIRHIATIMQ